MHGEAVSMGMVQLSRVAEEKGLMPKGISQQIEEMRRKFGLRPMRTDKEALYQALTHDKRRVGEHHEISNCSQSWGNQRFIKFPLQEMKDLLENKE